MSNALQGALCRISVIGPDRKVDLAVPSTTPVANLLPLLLRHATVAANPGEDLPDGAWVLQRLGQRPFELTGTPESLDWLEGEELYLRRAEDPLPELEFDDLAEGVAAVVNRRDDRWKPEYRRVLFLVLSVVGMAAIGGLLVDRGPVLPQVIGAGVLAVALLTAALVAARKLTDGAFALLLGCGAAFFAALASSSAVDGVPEGVAWTNHAVLAGAVATAAVMAILLLVQRTVTPHMPSAPVLVVGVTALITIGITLVHSGTRTTPEKVSSGALAVLFAVVVVAPRAAVKFARLRGPQLPKTGEDMRYDIEPEDPELVKARTNDADTYLTTAIGASALLLVVLFHFAMRVPGWSGWTLVAVVASAILLRARTFFGLWQRLALVAAGTVGYLMVVVKLSQMLGPGWRYVLFAVLLAVLLALVMAALRPWPRRMLPFWEYSATFLDVATGAAVLPVLAQTLGFYAGARGLFG
ncbi:type VII secretion integral membrane protein EccD [Micromonospora sp. NPDC005367]|uniref:type VII secretion integral membrane protein EccD n=1 Tax=Micromonospora sp. NPDC005367 TaxID=3155590 RepID=UPI0033AA46AF